MPHFAGIITNNILYEIQIHFCDTFRGLFLEPLPYKFFVVIHGMNYFLRPLDRAKINCYELDVQFAEKLDSKKHWRAYVF